MCFLHVDRELISIAIFKYILKFVIHHCFNFLKIFTGIEYICVISKQSKGKCR